jgi:hypothetical protein
MSIYCEWQQVCATRLRERMCNKAPNAWLSLGVAEKNSIGTFHPTIKSPEQGLSILASIASRFQKPLPHEGYERLMELRPSDQSLIYTPTDITSILQRLRDSTPVTSSVVASTGSLWTRGNSSFRGGRARGENNRHLYSMPRAARCASPYPINSRGRGSSVGHGFVAPAGRFDRTRRAVARSNNFQRSTDSRLSFRGGTSDSPNWRGSGSAEDPNTT